MVSRSRAGYWPRRRPHVHRRSTPVLARELTIPCPATTHLWCIFRSVKPGETKELTHTFDAAGQTIAGCHLPGHFGGGMKASVTVTG